LYIWEHKIQCVLVIFIWDIN